MDKAEKFEKLNKAKAQQITRLEQEITLLKDEIYKLNKKVTEYERNELSLKNQNLTLKAQNDELHEIIRIFINEIKPANIMVVPDEDD